jgi:hypothetical protein
MMERLSRPRPIRSICFHASRVSCGRDLSRQAVIGREIREYVDPRTDIYARTNPHFARLAPLLQNKACPGHPFERPAVARERSSVAFGPSRVLPQGGWQRRVSALPPAPHPAPRRLAGAFARLSTMESEMRSGTTPQVGGSLVASP